MFDPVIVIFSDLEPLPAEATRRDRWLDRAMRACLRPGFRHVTAMWRAEHFPGWIVLRSATNRLDVVEVADSEPITVPVPTFDEPVTFAHYGAMIAFMVHVGLATQVTAIRQPSPSWRLRGPLTCVEVVKHHLGVGGFFVWTPLQLWRRLVAETGEAGQAP